MSGSLANLQGLQVFKSSLVLMICCASRPILPSPSKFLSLSLVRDALDICGKLAVVLFVPVFACAGV